MGSFIREHWLAYLVGAAIAVVLGLGGAYILGVKWSTPQEVREDRIEHEKARDEEIDDFKDFLDNQA